MAKDLTKEILPIEEEQKQEKKLLYKNWKIYATALGVITVGLAVGLGVGLGVQHAHTVNTNKEHDIANQINQTTYILPNIINGETVANIKQQITTDFIKNQLNDSNSKNFKANSFKLNSITVTDGNTNRDLQDSDLTKDITINAQINYSYGASKNQVTNLTINISEKRQAEIINAINAITYSISNNGGTDSAKGVAEQITANFIQGQLTEDDNKNAFVTEAFTLTSITVADADDNTKVHNLKDENLVYNTQVNAQINYSYGSSIDNTTNLTISVNKATDQQIVDAINDATFSLTSISGDKAESVKSNITTVIKEQLNKNIQSSIDTSSIKINSVTVNTDNQELNDNNFDNYGIIINTKINYNYNEIENQVTDLNITVNANTNQVITIISETTFNLNVTINSSAESVSSLITSDFIKNQLTEGIIQNSFNSDSFNFNSIKVTDNNNDRDLQDNDLADYGTSINAKLIYKYDTPTIYETNLKITIMATNDNVINAINTANYTIDTYTNDTVANIKNRITNNNFNFIKTGLDEKIQNSFNSDLFSFDSITDSNDNKLNDTDLVKNETVKINFNYKNNENENEKKSTNLEIKTTNLTNESFDNLITSTTFENTVALTSEAITITQSIAKTIENQLANTSTALAELFKIMDFDLQSITIDSHDLVDSDLIKVQDLDATINYSLNDKPYTSKLTIHVTLDIQSIIFGGLDISKLVNDRNSHLTLLGVTTNSTDIQIKKSIINALSLVIKDVVGDQFWNLINTIVNGNISSVLNTTLDNNSPHTSVTITATVPFIKGTVKGTFELPEPTNN
ncbi:hypothetical protein [Spiroplasma attinicola]|uniref:hypothetical protein n=1 Tax=Spiroplasma attinicola TaxID=2904537 RepID=UPI002022B2E7|nr:hypothetical protein [Spiroplasma sp. JKS002670]MCL8209865.1 hypothetical protein [Spiroplasma sp. JKS002670]